MSTRQPYRQLIGRTNVAPSASAVNEVMLNVFDQTTQTARPVALPTLVGGSAREIRALALNVRAVFAIDDSGSMYGNFGDPTGIRYAAARSLVAMQRRSGGGLRGSRSLGHFGSRTKW